MSAQAPTTDLAADWDARVARALTSAPAGLRNFVDWLRAPVRKWTRLAFGLLLVLGGLLSILPILGLWMLPLGLALIGEDSPMLKRGLERTSLWLEARIATARGWWPSGK